MSIVERIREWADYRLYLIVEFYYEHIEPLLRRYGFFSIFVGIVLLIWWIMS